MRLMGVSPKNGERDQVLIEADTLPHQVLTALLLQLLQILFSGLRKAQCHLAALGQVQATLTGFSAGLFDELLALLAGDAGALLAKVAVYALAIDVEVDAPFAVAIG